MKPPATRRAVLLAGPTASGKSALAMWLAARLGGELVGADSLQIYKPLPLWTAAPDKAARRRIPHHLCQSRPASAPYNVGLWQSAAAVAIKRILKKNRVPIIVGGTGLYFRSLTHGLAGMPPSDPQIRADLRAELKQRGRAQLHAELQKIDSPSARTIAPTDTQRLLRALEVHRSTGRALSWWQAETTKPPFPNNQIHWRKILLAPNKDWLHRRITERLQTMLDTGALTQLRRFLATKPAPNNPLWHALGVRAFAAHLGGEISHADAFAKTAAQTRQYAKRQMTWFRKYMGDWQTYTYASCPNKQFYSTKSNKVLSFIAKSP